MTSFEHALLQTLIQESDCQVNVAVTRLQYMKLLRDYQGQYGEVDIVWALLSLQGYGYVRKPDARILGTVYLTELGLHASSSSF